MSRHRWHYWLTGSDSPLLLLLAAMLVSFQLVMWMTAITPPDARTRHTTAAVVHQDSSPAFSSRSQHRYARDSATAQNRYYDPSLALVAEKLDAASRYFIAIALEDARPGLKVVLIFPASQ